MDRKRNEIVSYDFIHYRVDGLLVNLTHFSGQVRGLGSELLHSQGCILDASIHRFTSVRRLTFMKPWAIRPIRHKLINIY